MPPKNDPEFKFHTYRGTELSYDMLYEPTSSDKKEKEGDNISGNRHINLKILTTNTKEILVCQQCAQETYLQINRKKKETRKIIYYVEAYYEITPTYENKRIRQLHHGFNQLKSNRQPSSLEYSLSVTFSEHINGIASTMVCN